MRRIWKNSKKAKSKKQQQQKNSKFLHSPPPFFSYYASFLNSVQVKVVDCFGLFIKLAIEDMLRIFRYLPPITRGFSSSFFYVRYIPFEEVFFKNTAAKINLCINSSGWRKHNIQADVCSISSEKKFHTL